MANPNHGTNGPVETKVTVAGVAAAVTTFIMTWLTMQTSFLDGVAAPLSAIILAIVSGALTFGASWWAKHTNRTDAKAAQGKHA